VEHQPDRPGLELVGEAPPGPLLPSPENAGIGVAQVTAGTLLSDLGDASSSAPKSAILNPWRLIFPASSPRERSYGFEKMSAGPLLAKGCAKRTSRAGER